MDKIEELRAKLLGSGEAMACCHPDVLGEDVGSKNRQCVIDQGLPDQCDIRVDEQYSSKTQCPYWQSVKMIAPQPLTIEEALALLTTIQTQSAALEAMAGALETFSKLAGTWTVETEPGLLTLSNGQRMCAIEADAFRRARTIYQSYRGEGR